jgi:Arginosuccinate synthase
MPVRSLNSILNGCSNALEDPWVEPKESMFTRSVSPEKAPDKPTYIEMDFERVHSCCRLVTYLLNRSCCAPAEVGGCPDCHELRVRRP